MINGVTQVMAKDFKYAPTGAETEWKHHTGIARRLAYDLDGRLTSIGPTGASGVQPPTYGYDAANRIPRIGNGVLSSRTQTCAYDALGHLTGAASPARSQTFGYDANSNRIEHGFGNGTTTFGYAGGGNRLTRISRGATVTPVAYTANGNTASVGDTRYTYNPFNRAARVVKDG